MRQRNVSEKKKRPDKLIFLFAMLVQVVPRSFFSRSSCFILPFCETHFSIKRYCWSAFNLFSLKMNCLWEDVRKSCASTIQQFNKLQLLCLAFSAMQNAFSSISFSISLCVCLLFSVVGMFWWTPKKKSKKKCRLPCKDLKLKLKYLSWSWKLCNCKINHFCCELFVSFIWHGSSFFFSLYICRCHIRARNRWSPISI